MGVHPPDREDTSGDCHGGFMQADDPLTLANAVPILEFAALVMKVVGASVLFALLCAAVAMSWPATASRSTSAR